MGGSPRYQSWSWSTVKVPPLETKANGEMIIRTISDEDMAKSNLTKNKNRVFQSLVEAFYNGKKW